MSTLGTSVRPEGKDRAGQVENCYDHSQNRSGNVWMFVVSPTLDEVQDQSDQVQEEGHSMENELK